MYFIKNIFFQKFPVVKVLALRVYTKKKEERSKIIEKFNNNPSIIALILALKIGRVGLYLASSNVALIYDHDWSPNKYFQTMNRAHR